MTSITDSLPAALRRAFFFTGVLCGVAAVAPAAAPANETPLAQIGKPDAAETARILEQFRRSGWLGYFEFELRSMPRRGRGTTFRGQMWGGLNEQGAVTRIELVDAKGVKHRFLLQNGENAAVWRFADGKVSRVEGPELFRPLLPELEITPFDLQMPFLYWPDARVEGVERVLGRPAYAFVFAPPADFAKQSTDVKFVRAFFDAQFNAPVRIEQTDARRVIKVMTLIALKKVGEETIPKTFDVRNERTGDKTRFQIKAAALRVPFPPRTFQPEGLADEVAPPDAGKVVQVD